MQNSAEALVKVSRIASGSASRSVSGSADGCVSGTEFFSRKISGFLVRRLTKVKSSWRLGGLTKTLAD